MCQARASPGEVQVLFTSFSWWQVTKSYLSGTPCSRSSAVCLCLGASAHTRLVSACGGAQQDAAGVKAARLTPGCCLQAACTAKELKELVTMPTIAVHAAADQLAVSEADKAEMKAVRLKRRIFELISNVSRQHVCAVSCLPVLFCLMLALHCTSEACLMGPRHQLCCTGVLHCADCDGGVIPAGSRRAKAGR